MKFYGPDPLMTEIRHERYRQDEKWGEQNHTLEKWAVILGEEYGEFCKAVFEQAAGNDTLAHVRGELIQVAAVAVAIIECMDRERERAIRYYAS